MNILLTGSSDPLIRRLIVNLNKEGHRVSVLTGSYHQKQRYEGVFEQYQFPYTSNYLQDILNSASPELVIFTGAFDSSFSWHDTQNAAAAFVSAVMNVLNVFSAYGKGRLVFLSSDAVFQYRPLAMAKETQEPDAQDLKGMALAEAESLCAKYRSHFGLDIVTLRLGGCYHKPKDAGEVQDLVSKICLDTLRYGKANIGMNHALMPLSENDAAFFICRAATAETCGYPLYHISSGNLVSLQHISDMAQQAMEEELSGEKAVKAADPKEKKEGEAPAISAAEIRQPLDTARFREEFGINRVRDLGTDVKDIVSYMLKNRELFRLEEEKGPDRWAKFRETAGYLLRAVVPYVENVVCFVIVFFLNARFADSFILSKLDFYLLYVLLFAVLYGQTQAVVSAFLSLIGMLVGQLAVRTGAETLLDYSTYSWVAQLFIVGLVVGYLKDRLSEQKEEALDDHEYMADQVDDIREINGSNSRVKDALETQLVNHDDSVGKIYEITSSLNTHSSVELLFYAVDVFRRIMDSPDVALYVVHEDNPYARLFTATSAMARQLGASFRYGECEEMMKAFREKKVYFNRTLERGLPAMAAPVYEQDQLRFIVMVWTLPFEKMTMGQSNILTVVCTLMQESSVRARNYAEAIRHTQVLEGTDVLLAGPFRSLLITHEEAAMKRLTEFVVLRFEAEGGDVKATGLRLQDLLRLDDYIGLGQDGGLYALISNTGREGGEKVCERLRAAGLTVSFADPESITELSEQVTT